MLAVTVLSANAAAMFNFFMLTANVLQCHVLKKKKKERENRKEKGKRENREEIGKIEKRKRKKKRGGKTHKAANSPLRCVKKNKHPSEKKVKTP